MDLASSEMLVCQGARRSDAGKRRFISQAQADFYALQWDYGSINLSRYLNVRYSPP